jgi:perosamine synthetase
LILRRTISDADLARIRHLIPRMDPVVELPVDSATGRRIIPVADTNLNGNELLYLTECVKSGWISSAGSFVGRFEEGFAKAVGCRFGVSCSSGTAALHLALATLGIGPGDQVIIPAFTMIATANAVSYTGATPVLVDSRPETWNIDVSKIDAKIGPSTRAIIVVHTYGHPVDMDVVLRIAAKHHLHVIEDAAEAHGAEYNGRPIGSLGDVATFSFYANKIVTTGEGGMLTTNNENIAAVARKLRDHAFSDERHFWHEYLGFNFRMTNLQAAIGVAQTERLTELVARRRENARLYTSLLQSQKGLNLPIEETGVKNVFWMYGLLVRKCFGCTRDELRSHLAKRGIETRTFFIPIHFQPIYFDSYRGERYPIAELLCQKGMYLPSGANLSEEDIRYVADSVIQAGTSTA